jgi:YihY family inner membrane protein
LSSVAPVPETQLRAEGDLTGQAVDKKIWTNRRRLVVEAFIRFRYGDGFSNARALGLQLSLTTVPLMIATVGLSDAFYAERIGTVVRRTILSLTPGASDPMVRTALERPQEGDVSQLALWFGLAVAVIAMTTAMGQVERGANRIYGIQRDRPTLEKYSRAFVMVFAAGLPATMAYAILLAGPSFGEAVEREFGREDDVVSVVALPLGVALLLMSVTMMLRFSPRRRQPGWAILAVGAFAALLLSLAFTAVVAIYLFYSDDFGRVYGPLTAVVVLLLWSQLTGIAILYGAALSAQVEAESAGVHDGAHCDPHGDY